jgi:hypothetical protein
MIRFHIAHNGDSQVTDWEDEPVKFGSTATAVARVVELRKQFGAQAAIKVERDVTPLRQPQDWVRFQLTVGSDIRFTNPVLAKDADKLAAQLKVDYPNAVLSRKEWKA